jgi:high-affinity iron transporter
VLTLRNGRRPGWLPWGLLAGAALALLYALNIRTVSEWFDYVGQEVVNAALQAAIAVVIVMLAFMTGRMRDVAPDQASSRTGPTSSFGVLCALAVTLAITREGSEVWVYLSGFFAQQDKLQAVLVGSSIGFGIGLSAGFLLFYGLMVLRGGWGRWAPVALLALFSGNMLAQSALQLAQADWLQAGATLWDTSGWLAEDSVAGRLLYALVGYESRPSATQVLGYLAGVIAVLLAVLAGRRSR